MILIAHRGNTQGPNELLENTPDYLAKAVADGFDVEVDIWCFRGSEFFLGHDGPQHPVSLNWLNEYRDKAWFHCKNYAALLALKRLTTDFHFFWHESDRYTLTSRGVIWVYPGQEVQENSILVLPEKSSRPFDDENYSNLMGICSDYVQQYT